MVEHVGDSIQNGHYVCYSQTQEGWAHFDDATVCYTIPANTHSTVNEILIKVEKTDLEDVLNKSAYILVYTEIPIQQTQQLYPSLEGMYSYCCIFTIVIHVCLIN